MNSHKILTYSQTAAISLICLAISAGNVAAQTPREYRIPTEKLTCLVENQQKYMELPRAIILLSPENCPAIGNEEVAGLAVNSAADVEKAERLLMTKTDFACLVTMIDAHLRGQGATPTEETDAVSFVLDCP